MTTVKVIVTAFDIEKATRDPSRCPVTRAVSRILREDINDVDINSGNIYIWDEWDTPREVYILNSDASSFVCNWEQIDNSEPFDFEMTKRR